jgi:thiopeptide-type bacteriocin biosynthesis protein
LLAHALGETAIALASESLAANRKGRGARAAVERYGRRAAFRATPAGLLAGVCVGALGEATAIATGRPRAVLAPTWARMAALGRALLDDEATRARARLRAAPSLLRGATTARWLAPGEPYAEERVADLDGGLGALLDATERWTTWAAARRAAVALSRGADGDPDDLLLLLVDEGLLHADVTPPLVGPEAATWMQARLARLGRVELARALEGVRRALARGDLARGAEELAALPGAAAGADLHGVLVHGPRRTPTLDRAAVERAAALAPLLFRLQEVLAPPASERLAQPAFEEALDAATERGGAGALDLGALAAGEYGVDPVGDGDDEPREPRATPPLLGVLVDALMTAAGAGRAEAVLDPDALAEALGEVGPAPPPTCELFLAPSRGRAPAGAGWLLGLHAPAGSSWGRFAAALGAPLARALEALARAERDARPDEEALDVSFAPSPALAELCAHPRVRRRALALSSWPEERTDGDGADRGSEEPDLAARDLELVADRGAAVPLALRSRTGGRPVTPSPLARVRSATAPAGLPRLLAGWSLFRQHAPWALALEPLAELAHVPRLVLGGFVVAPASWRIPDALRASPPERAARAALRRWRRAAGVPRVVQIGHEDQLLAVDLDAPGAAAELAGHDRACEIWPPLGRGVDRDGRRVEAIVALVDRPDPDDTVAQERAAREVAEAPRVPPPRLQPPPPDWRTFEIHGPPEHQDALLVDVVGPAIAEARRAKEINGWFFQRYVDAGRRHHLRLRVRAATPRARVAFEARLEAALLPARQTGAVVDVAARDYHPERARFAGALDAVHAVFESESDLACALLARAPDDDEAPERLTPLVRTLDALARGLGLDLEARHALARARRAAAEATAPVDAERRAAADLAFRARARALRAALGAPAPEAATRALEAHATRTRRATRAQPTAARAALAPSLLHLACVRLAGPDRDLERLAYTLWERALEGLRRAPPAPSGRKR